MAWHEDGFTLPPLGYELASNAFGVQAFCHCRHLARAVPSGGRRGDRLRLGARRTTRDLVRAGKTREDLDPAPYAAGGRRAPPRILFDGFAARAGLVAVASSA